jgi:hypothetical protein
METPRKVPVTGQCCTLQNDAEVSLKHCQKLESTLKHNFEQDRNPI